MARYKFVDMSPRFLPVVLEDQLVPGSFAHAVRARTLIACHRSHDRRPHDYYWLACSS